jgi:hypothetical protein
MRANDSSGLLDVIAVRPRSNRCDPQEEKILTCEMAGNQEAVKKVMFCTRL